MARVDFDFPCRVEAPRLNMGNMIKCGHPYQRFQSLAAHSGQLETTPETRPHLDNGAPGIRSATHFFPSYGGSYYIQIGLVVEQGSKMSWYAVLVVLKLGM